MNKTMFVAPALAICLLGASPISSFAQTTHHPVAQSAQKITVEKAKKIALEKVGGGTVIECDYESDDGVAKYEIDIKKDQTYYEVEIDAKSGKVLEVEKESVNDNENEANDD